MVPNSFPCILRGIVLHVGLGLSMATAQSTIFSDNFDGGTGNISTLAPDVRSGSQTWTASPIFNANGTVDRPATDNQGSMTLPFIPANGFVYTLDASFSGVTGDTDWFALGFAKGQRDTSTSSDRFLGPNVTGATWMLFRGTTPAPLSTNGNKIQRGLEVSNPADWLDAGLGDQEGGAIDMRIVLDTTGGTGAWTATWYAKLPASGSYTLVGNTTTVPHAASNYTSVGIAASNTSPTTGTGGTIESFSLTSNAVNTPPTIIAKTPEGASGFYPGTDLVATFSEDVALKAGGTITIRNLGDPSGASDLVITLPSSQATLSGRNLVINPSANLPFNTNFAVRISTNAVEDTANPASPFAGIENDITWTFSTAAQDLTAALLNLRSPLDNTTNVARSTNIVATFDKGIIRGSGNITLKDLDDGSTTQVIPVSDTARVTISGNLLTIDPPASLAAGKNYAVQIATGAVKNFSDVDFPGIPATDDTSWNFQTRAATPNVIFMLADDQSWYDYSFMRRANVEQAAINMQTRSNTSIPQFAKTPAIDRLADEGLAFIHGYTAPVCRPTLMSIITGTHLHQHWIVGNDLVSARGLGQAGRIDDTSLENRILSFNPLTRTLSSQLGYTSFQTGKWWEGDFANGDFTQGDTRDSTAPSTRPAQWNPASGGTFLPPGNYVRARQGDWGLMTGRVDYVNGIAAPDHPIPYANTVKTATDFINTQVAADQPFFLWYAPYLPHDPFDPPEGLKAQYTALGLNSTDANFYANIERLDGGVDAILDHLDTKGIANNTIIMFICDNGRQFNTPNTDGKTSPYDSGARTPIIVRWPDRIKPGGLIEPQVIRTPVHMVDMVPTVHHALGLPVPPEMQGINLLDSAAVAARGTICGSDHDVEILTLSDPTESLENRWAVRNGWKLILNTTGTKELYRLYNGSTPVDPHEKINLAASNPQLVNELTMEIVNWYSPVPNDYDSWVGDPALGIAPANRGFDLDIDGDGLTNGVEAWFGTDPRAFNKGLVEIATNGLITTFRHALNPQASDDLTATYEWSTDMVNWYAGNGIAGPPGGSTVNIVASPAQTSTTVTATSSAAQPRLFLRARVKQN